MFVLLAKLYGNFDQRLLPILVSNPHTVPTFPLCCNSFTYIYIHYISICPFATHSLLLFLILLPSSLLLLCRFSGVSYASCANSSVHSQLKWLSSGLTLHIALCMYLNICMYKSHSLYAVFCKNYNLINACRTVSSIICHIVWWNYWHLICLLSNLSLGSLNVALFIYLH